ncbi:hypothetical protein JDV02_007343 [Purpureocillium takamizusanense]|uniref:INSIG domain-containing protein n=1 Tax=Purpureocillium takamizusanense TaxID=2060973 RepID=A0A9Q8QKM6_9HYPO|nr:uncharacterized protein JDV02_007343 [Purpureocillium takamizusanense]UNI21345.1 hypothetical protein JDV02_007343 [Purpureocillium takamizusanense]
MADDGPQLLRPIPRRPFNLNLTSATPPDDDDQDSPQPGFALRDQDFSAPRFLNAGMTPVESGTSISRPQSFMNLTSSTLMGIYSQARGTSNRLIDREDIDTPWGTGAQTPIKRPSIDDATFELMRDRSHLPRRRSSYRPADASSASNAGSVAARAFRASLLFMLGVGYGMIVTRLHNEQQYLADLAEGIIKPGANGRYLAFWGVSGVVLGSLLPWFDRVWVDMFGDEVVDETVVIADADGSVDKELGPGTDWALVMRAIGAFVGIIFAIRKLPWASSLQVSATLALVNPLLWWLIDRSKPGFVLSAGVGLIGSVLLLGLNPEMMPAPSSRLSPLGQASQNASVDADVTGASTAQNALLGGLAEQETIETGVWMLSVLFCSCLCFGNIGRRLAWSRGAGGRGRWGGVR